MNRQQKREALRNVAKQSLKIRNGTATIKEIQIVTKEIKKLQAVGVLPPSKKRSVFHRTADFFRKMLGADVGYIRS